MPIQVKDFLAGRMENFLRTRLYDETHGHGKSFRPSITISRQTGVGFEKIHQKLVEYLDEADDSDGETWAIFDQALVGQIIEDNRLDDEVEPYLVENTKIPVVEALEQMLNLHPSEWTLFNYTANTIRKLCSSGHAVVSGRAGNFITADLPNTFHIRLVGSLPKRIEELQQRLDIDHERATSIIADTDKAKEKYVKRYTGADISDPCFYHMVINTDNCSDELLVKLIVDPMMEWAFEKERARAER
ncbi:MAG: cytidylate kinase-like family protein [Verrucomicrobiales bacterium]|nr:cytidylate kinase-like family protein [Verrucomicrobiales bacterium]